MITSVLGVARSFPTHLAFRKHQMPSVPLMHSTTEETSVSGQVASSAISKNISELSEELGGNGRALIAWDLYRQGIDPELFFGDQSGTYMNYELVGRSQKKLKILTMRDLSNFNFNRCSCRRC